ncbi:MAG: phosphatidylglycerophosphatase A [Candidatus Ratteibacteria bacterium]
MEILNLFEEKGEKIKSYILKHSIFEKKTKTLIFSFDKKRKILSTLEGFKEVKFVGINSVPRRFWEMNSEEWIKYKDQIKKNLGYNEDEISLLFTGVDVENFGICEENFKNYKIICFATCGVKSNSLTVASDKGNWYEKNGKFYKIGTINVLFYTNCFLTESGFLNSLITITEAKTKIFQDFDIRSIYSGLENQATGTGTDNIIFISGDKEKITYAGGHSKFGEILAKTVYFAIKESMEKQNKIFIDRPIIERLRERGIRKEDIIKTAMETYIEDKKIGDKNKVKKLFEKELEKILNDVNISSLIIAGLKLHEEGKKGIIPNLKDYENDPVELIADEIIGIQIAEYIGGKLALFEFERIDRTKPGIIKKLPPFIDDIIGGLIAGIMVKICSK